MELVDVAIREVVMPLGDQECRPVVAKRHQYGIPQSVLRQRPEWGPRENEHLRGIAVDLSSVISVWVNVSM